MEGRCCQRVIILNLQASEFLRRQQAVALSQTFKQRVCTELLCVDKGEVLKKKKEQPLLNLKSGVNKMVTA